MTLVYKILTDEQWDDLERKKEIAGAPIDVEDGFVHLSAENQVAGTLAKHFSGQTNLVLAAVEEDSLGKALKWEVSRDGAKFPHLYSKFRMEHVVWKETIILGADGKHVLPRTLEG
mmetsp:Transcript_25511/g.38689  ORF Transcript_25511/g.38689 Transcript_25511/m.38689 type:complete len:116 (-) Transcript_25511:347-694(-)|eukprot:CAMPEP_0178903184 /NCGR_PEP_ID=MMETSP0786-20121207/5017_1 /TAXON_ID=186022 /ORGANISM="Thalassionema frauenfeldii, Strain CCMP 1798" /LENGTH=115 /DNA_ID=CAMNT_0020574529 /DNA_START=54 /DNA_END=401 /DNA_ORIENTATION=-